MRVLFRSTYCGPAGSFRAGTINHVADAEGERLLKAGYVRQVDENDRPIGDDTPYPRTMTEHHIADGRAIEERLGKVKPQSR